MRWLIVLLVSILVLGDLLGTGMSLGPGLSVKNAVLYFLALALVARLALSDKLRLDMPGLHVGWAILIGYAILSWLAAGLVIRYPHYDLVDRAISLKATLVDPALFFFAAFHALRTSADVRLALKAFAFAFTAANFFTIMDVVGLMDFGVRIGSRGAEAGRVFGVFGHANETAGLIVCLAPCVVALAVSSRGIVRFAWWAAALVSVSVLVMTVSRGAFVAAAVGTVLGVFLCRRAIPAGVLARGAALAGVSLILVIGLVMLLNPDSTSIVKERLLIQSTSTDLADASSGRTFIWGAAVDRMMQTPISLLTGFGWDAYDVLPFRYATHNHYLSLWFDLGLPGVAIFVFMLVYVIATARRALAAPSGELRPYLIGFVFGMLSLTIAIFFGNQNSTWPYAWLYIGIVMRAAVLTLAPARHTRSAKERSPPVVRTERKQSAGEPVATQRPAIYQQRP